MSESTAAVTPDAFLITQEYRLFAEFCDACRRYRYIGLCWGPPGVGKTLSARYYARWDTLAAVFELDPLGLELPGRPELADCRTIVYTPSMTTTPKRLGIDVHKLQWSLRYTVEAAQHAGEDDPASAPFDDRWTALVIVDEADRLKFPLLEQLRDIYDRGRFGLVLIGMPGIEKRLARYAQFYSRVGFVHQFRTLSVEAMRLILAHKWEQLGLRLRPDDFSDAEAMAAIIRITGGNFRLVHRLFSQIERILQINGLQAITPDVIEAARQSLVIGPA
jgi:DNA transposition AAA+ family ATPase